MIYNYDTEELEVPHYKFNERELIEEFQEYID